MQRMKLGWVVMGIGCLVSGGVMGQVADQYESPTKAWEAFDKATDDAVRSGAYGWMKQRAETCPNSATRDIFPSLGKMARQLGRDEEFKALCAARMAGASEPQDLRVSVTVFLAEWYADGNDPEAGLKVLADILKRVTEIEPGQQAWLVTVTSHILSSKLSRHEEAAKLLAETLDRVKDSEDVIAVVRLAHTLSSLLYSKLSDVEGAERVIRQALAREDVANAAHYHAGAVHHLALLEKEKGNGENAVATLMSLLKPPAFPQGGIAQRIINYGAKSAELEECVRLLRQRIAAPARDLKELRARFQQVQEVVDFLIALGRYEEALCECRVLMFVSEDKAYPAAVDRVARTFKLLDGNLGRANAFLKFQQAEAGEVLKNPLMGLPALNDAVRAEANKALDEGPKPMEWEDWLMRSAYLLWLDRPADAMDAASKAFVLSPISDASLQACSAAVARPLLVATRDTEATKQIVDYLLWGEGGEDGNLKNPFPEARQRLAYPPAK